jgi:hypothetical protein
VDADPSTRAMRHAWHERSHPLLFAGGKLRTCLLVETTPEVNREVAESALLLSHGARRAIEMKREAAEVDAHAVPAAAD